MNPINSKNSDFFKNKPQNSSIKNKFDKHNDLNSYQTHSKIKAQSTDIGKATIVNTKNSLENQNHINPNINRSENLNTNLHNLQNNLKNQNISFEKHEYNNSKNAIAENSSSIDFFKSNQSESKILKEQNINQFQVNCKENNIINVTSKTENLENESIQIQNGDKINFNFGKETKFQLSQTYSPHGNLLIKKSELQLTLPQNFQNGGNNCLIKNIVKEEPTSVKQRYQNIKMLQKSETSEINEKNPKYSIDGEIYKLTEPKTFANTFPTLSYFSNISNNHNISSISVNNKNDIFQPKICVSEINFLLYDRLLTFIDITTHELYSTSMKSKNFNSDSLSQGLQRKYSLFYFKYNTEDLQWNIEPMIEGTIDNLKNYNNFQKKTLDALTLECIINQKNIQNFISMNNYKGFIHIKNQINILDANNKDYSMRHFRTGIELINWILKKNDEHIKKLHDINKFFAERISDIDNSFIQELDLYIFMDRQKTYEWSKIYTNKKILCNDNFLCEIYTCNNDFMREIYRITIHTSTNN